MRLLLSNDDGYLAPGLAALAEALSPIAEITVVAPDRDRSGASNSLTLDRPLTVRRAANGFLYVNGTPTDCVHLAMSGLLPELPDMVVSGVNHGANMAEDTHYSGTVAAAMEGFFMGIPAIAVSMVGPGEGHFATAAAVARELVEHCVKTPFGHPFFLNVNVPDLPAGQIRGREVTRLGRRHPAQPLVPAQSPRGETVYWIGAVGSAREGQAGSDFDAISRQCVSITPLQVDLTWPEQVAPVRDWLKL